MRALVCTCAIVCMPRALRAVGLTGCVRVCVCARPREGEAGGGAQTHGCAAATQAHPPEAPAHPIPRKLCRGSQASLPPKQRHAPTTRRRRAFAARASQAEPIQRTCSAATAPPARECRAHRAGPASKAATERGRSGGALWRMGGAGGRRAQRRAQRHHQVLVEDGDDVRQLQLQRDEPAAAPADARMLAFVARGWRVRCRALLRARKSGTTRRVSSGHSIPSSA